MTRWIPLFCMVVVFFDARPGSPTSVVPPSFDELVSKAEVIFVGEVVDRRSVWEETAQGRSIVTRVTFDVTRVIKGRLGLRTELTFVGGTLGDVTLHIADMPEFAVGDRDVLFLSPEHYALSPLVGFAYGRFRIVRDSANGVDRVHTHDGRPLLNAFDLGKPLVPARQTIRPMTLSDFESVVRQKADALRAR